MKRTLFTFLIFVISLVEVHAQNKTECFRTYQDYKSDNAFLLIDYKLTQKTSGELIMMGGIRDYSFKDIDDKILKRKLKKEIWGMQQDGKTYINSYPFSKFKGFNEILGTGHYRYFIGPAPTSLDKKNQLRLGFIKSGEPAMYMTSTSVPYVLLNDGTIKYLSIKFLGQLVDGTSELEVEIKSLDDRDFKKMFEILDRLNELKN